LKTPNTKKSWWRGPEAKYCGKKKKKSVSKKANRIYIHILQLQQRLAWHATFKCCKVAV
jgi:hypothetical protein